MRFTLPSGAASVDATVGLLAEKDFVIPMTKKKIQAALMESLYCNLEQQEKANNVKELEVNVKDFSDEHPSKEGKYLRLAEGSIQLITVVRVPAKSAYGMEWAGFLGVAEMRCRNVEHLSGKFIKLKF